MTTWKTKRTGLNKLATVASKEELKLASKMNKFVDKSVHLNVNVAVNLAVAGNWNKEDFMAYASKCWPED